MLYTRREIGTLALAAIPATALTDRGLVDVNKFDFVELLVD